ncbi:MAG: class C sortase [Ruminococcus sp.]|nr:class C sortase [Ruminococcus sp.]
MKKIILISIAAVLIAVGLFLILFEPVSNEIGKQEAHKLVDEFEEVIAQAQKETPKEKKKTKKNESSAESGADSSTYTYSSGSDYVPDRPTRESLERLLEDSKAYNKKLVSNQGTVKTSNYRKAALNLRNYGITSNIFCYISAPKIGMKLPVYLGASDSVLNSGAAHLSYTSLPVNQKSTNCVIAAHTGYIGRTYFDNIHILTAGDEVMIRNYSQTIHYKVIEKKIVKPEDTRDLYIQYGRQLLTLYTCIRNNKGDFDRCIVICEKK